MPASASLRRSPFRAMSFGSAVSTFLGGGTRRVVRRRALVSTAAADLDFYVYGNHKFFMFDQHMSCFSSGNFNSDGAEKPIQRGGADLRSKENRKFQIDKICSILDSGPWGADIETSLASLDMSFQPDVIVGTLRRQTNLKSAINYFRWVESKTGQVHCPGAYNSIIRIMAANKNIEDMEKILEEMSLSEYQLLNDTCIEVIRSLTQSRMFKEAVRFIDMMLKSNFRPAFSAYTTLIGALANAREPDLALNMFHQMQEVGYDVNVWLFTTLVRVFAKEGRIDAALSILDEMRSNAFTADIVLYNVCINCFGKAGKVDMAWKFFHEMKAQGMTPDDVSYSSLIGVLCKTNRLNDAIQLFEQMELNRSVPCAYVYNTMIMGYGSVGKFDEALELLQRLKEKGCIPSVIAYNSILTCLGKSGKVDEACQLFEDMKKDATPNISTYNILIDMLCMEGYARPKNFMKHIRYLKVWHKKDVHQILSPSVL